MDIFEWWRTMVQNFRYLKKMAREYLTAPATSVSSERLFSLAGNVITKKRNRMNPETSKTIMCLNSWLDFKLLNV